MAAKPTPSGSDGTYGTELNAFLDVSLASDGKIINEALQTASTAPSADAALANKKYVDDNTTMVPAVSGAGTGYAGEESVTFANGLIMKTGTSASIAVNVSGTITFGTAFPTAILRAIITPNRGDTSDCHGSVHTKAVGSFKIINTGAIAITFDWIAIGR